MRAVDEIFIRELNRLNEKSKEGELSLEELRKLNLITSSLKQYMSNPIDDSDEARIEKLSIEELLELAKEDG